MECLLLPNWLIKFRALIWLSRCWIWGIDGSKNVLLDWSWVKMFLLPFLVFGLGSFQSFFPNYNIGCFNDIFHDYFKNCNMTVGYGKKITNSLKCRLILLIALQWNNEHLVNTMRRFLARILRLRSYNVWIINTSQAAFIVLLTSHSAEEYCSSSDWGDADILLGEAGPDWIR